MKKQIIRVSPIQPAKVAALMYFLLSIPMVALMAMSFAFAPVPGPRFGFGFMILFPIAYLVFGFVFTAMAAWLYNLAAGWWAVWNTPLSQWIRRTKDNDDATASRNQ